LKRRYEGNGPFQMQLIDISADDLISGLLSLDGNVGVCILDSCNNAHSNSQMLIAGVRPIETYEITERDPTKTLFRLDEFLTGDKAVIFTISYDLGRKLEKIGYIHDSPEPDLFVSVFDHLIVHNYRTGTTYLTGDVSGSSEMTRSINPTESREIGSRSLPIRTSSNFSRTEYIAAINAIKERIRRGDTYQTNLTHQIRVDLPGDFSKREVFKSLRQKHPAPFAAYLERSNSTVISASPERFFRVGGSHIETSPIKGTRPRGATAAEDRRMRNDLQTSQKDRAENTMIVDLLRNDLGRVCEYGSIGVRELCSVQELPTLFHLVSTIEGELQADKQPSDIIRALFPSGSITGAPKISTMKIIDELEPDQRGLSMGAIGIYIPRSGFDLPSGIDMSVAIRTMVVRDETATFNVGGGITIDSDPVCEYQESLIKAKALLDSLGVKETEFNVLEHFSTRVV